MWRAILLAGTALLLMGGNAAAFFIERGGGPLPAPQVSRFRQENLNNLGHLKAGMSRTEVVAVMGEKKNVQAYNLYRQAEVLSNPYRTETVTGKGMERFDIDFYFAYQKKADMKITIDELCPVLFRNGTLEGWGWEFYEKVIGPAPTES